MTDPLNGNRSLSDWNKRVVRWGQDFDPKYRRVAKILGWACDTETHTTILSVAGIQRAHKKRFRTVPVPSRATVFRHLADLRAHGVIEVQPRERWNGSQTSNETKVVFSRTIRGGISEDWHDFWAPLKARNETPLETPLETPADTPMRPLELSRELRDRTEERTTISSTRDEERETREPSTALALEIAGIVRKHWPAAPKVSVPVLSGVLDNMAADPEIVLGTVADWLDNGNSSGLNNPAAYLVKHLPAMVAQYADAREYQETSGEVSVWHFGHRMGPCEPTHYFFTEDPGYGDAERITLPADLAAWALDQQDGISDWEIRQRGISLPVAHY